MVKVLTMWNKIIQKILIFVLGLLSVGILFVTTSYKYEAKALSDNNQPEYYQSKKWHNRDGIGKFYQGREIAKVVGHQEMLWLERPSRLFEEKPEAAIEALNLRATDVVADIGAGTGYFSFRLAQKVPEGKVLAVDIQPEMLDVVNFIKEDSQVNNLETVLGEVDNPKLPLGSVDLALIVDAYHEFEYPREVMEGVVKGLKVGARVALLEYRLENPLIAIKGLHKMSQKQIKKEMTSVGLVFQESKEILPQQHLMIFSKPVS